MRRDDSAVVEPRSLRSACEGHVAPPGLASLESRSTGLRPRLVDDATRLLRSELQDAGGHNNRALCRAEALLHPQTAALWPLVHRAVLHHEDRVFGCGDVLQGVAGDGDDVG